MKLILVYLLFFPLFAVAEDDPRCLPLKSVEAPAVDRPKKEALPALKGCDAEALYYGIGHPTDYAKARDCAFAQLEAGDEEVFGGSAILMMIYANGYGVKKNIPLAKKFACNFGAPAEIEGRLTNLDKPQKQPFDFCEDITSGLAMGYCAAHRERFESEARRKDLDRLTSKWSATELEAFKKLRSGADKFGKSRASEEIDLSGSARAAFVIAEEAIQERDFIESIGKLENKKAPRYTAAQLKSEDLKLNELYTKALKANAAESPSGITSAGIKKTQLAWLEYRDAWIEFAKLKYPGYSSDSVKAWFTKKRNHMLSGLVS